MAEPGTIVDVAASNPDFETLVAAVTAAGLAETLSGEGPFTVFAPTDEAFDALPEGVLDALLLPENKDALTSILTYHVVSGEVMAADVTAGDVPTVEGSTIAITTDGGVQGQRARQVTATDVDASNGVIHVIDAVLVPGTPTWTSWSSDRAAVTRHRRMVRSPASARSPEGPPHPGGPSAARPHSQGRPRIQLRAPQATRPCLGPLASLRVGRMRRQCSPSRWRGFSPSAAASSRSPAWSGTNVWVLRGGRW